MKKFKNIISFVLIFTAVILLNYARCDAEVQYSDNVIPTMTSNTAPSGVVSASSVVNANYHAYNAFDHDTSNVYHAWVSAVSTGWLEYDFANPKCITKYTIASRPYDGVDGGLEIPKNWTFEAWDEQTQQWIVLDTKSNITTWSSQVKKDFPINNSKYYSKYRINVSANNGSIYTSIGELEMMETVASTSTTPSNLLAIARDTKVDLTWDAVNGATNYNIKRSTTLGGPYDKTFTSTLPSFSDTDLINGTTYYYIVTAVTSSGESTISNEASAMPSGTSSISGNRAILVITFTNGKEKEYDLSATEIDAFTDWYDKRSEGIVKSYFAIRKYSNVKPFISRKEYIKFDYIESFEIKDYNDIG